MKKSILFAVAVLFLLSAGNLPAEAKKVPEQGKALMRFGVISDFQVYRENDPTFAYLEKAFQLFRKNNVDAVVVAGDVSGISNVAVYKRFRKTFDDVFAGTSVKFLPVMGNHDFRGNHIKDMEEARKIFMEHMKVDKLDRRVNVKGFDFVLFNPDSGKGEQYSDEVGKFVEQEIKKSIGENSGKPVFAVSHHPSAFTFYGTKEGKGQIFKFLKKYEQVIHFAGHTHYPLADERIINQKHFTAVQTSTLYYGCLERYDFGRRGKHPYAFDVKECLLVSVYPEEILIRRFSVKNGNEIKKDSPWRVPLPLKKANFIYTDARKDKRALPEFPASAKGTAAVDKVPFKTVTLTFTAAVHPDFVHSYKLDIYRKDEKGNLIPASVGKFIFSSGFYRGLEKMTNEVKVQIPGNVFDFEVSTEYIFMVYPVESFGKTGKNGLKIAFRTPGKKAVMPLKKGGKK